MAGLDIAVYNLKQAERVHGKYDKKNAVVLDIRKVKVSYADKHNRSFKENGSYFEINEGENKKFIELAKKKNPELFEDDSKNE